MGNKFEDEFMELQSDFVSLCLEVAEQKVNKVYIYCSIEKKSTMFNAFFEIDGKIKTLNQLGIDNEFKYEEVCSAKTGKNAGEVFSEWISEIKG